MSEMCGLNGRTVVISVSQDRYRDRIIMTLYSGGLHHNGRMRKEENGKAMLWSPHANGQES